MIDIQKSRREAIRWFILVVAHQYTPNPVSETAILYAIAGEYPDLTLVELRKQLDYLESRKLLTINDRHTGTWSVDITRLGVDIVEYTVECDPGISRPKKV